MIYICVICMVKRPPLSPLTAEHRTLLEAIVSPIIKTDELKACHCQWLLCADCKLLMQTLYNFQQTALIGIKNLKYLLHKLNTEQTRAKVADTTPSVTSIKIEPKSVVSTSAAKEEFVTVDAPRNVNPLSEELDLKLEPEVLESEHEPGFESEYDSEATVSCKSEVNGPSDEKPISVSAPITRPVQILPKVNPLSEELDLKLEPEVLESEHEPGFESEYDSEATVSCESEVNGPSDEKPISVSAPITRPVQILPKPATAGSEGVFEVFTHNPPPSKKLPYHTSIQWKNGVRDGSEKRVRKKPKRRPCPHCDKSLSDNCHLKMHIRRFHSELAPCKCDVCGRQCRNEEVLKDHKRCHGKTRTIDDMIPELFCKDCCTQFPSRSSYKIHLKSLKHTPREQYEFECGTCKRRFPNEKRLKSHVDVVHLRQKKHKCHICDRAYGKINDVRRHIDLVHEKIARPTHVCHQCGKTFTVRKSLEEHLLTHEGIRPHQCPLCPATFTYRAALYTHNKLKHLKIKGKWKKKKKKVQKEGKAEEEKRAGR